MARIETVIYTDYEQKITIGDGDSDENVIVDVSELDGSKFSRLYLSHEDAAALIKVIENVMKSAGLK